jgi:hypothetical protein
MNFKQFNIKMLPMVSWFNLKQLANTAYESIVSKLIGSRADRRLTLALLSNEKEFYNYTKRHTIVKGRVEPVEDSKRNELWLDFIADTGDGWNPVYSVAYYAAKPLLELKSGTNTYQTKRGEVLIFGGDEVYPTPTRKAYRERLIVPYEQAFGDDKPDEAPHLFALPGNHDWYDGLEAFSRLFCSDLGSRKFAGWYTRQKRSYFALKLPCGWWLLGSDGQLHANIDSSQMEYFRNIADNHMKEGDRVILCTSEPSWIFAHKYRQYDSEYDESDLIFLQNEILAPKNIDVKVYLSGDQHYYRRHEEIYAEENNAKTQKIVAGGGGAFLHPTHGFDFSLIREDKQLPGQKPREFKEKACYPDEKTSKRLGWLNLLFPLQNPGFGLLTGVMYFVTIWIVSSTFRYEFPHGIAGYLDQTLNAFVLNPLATLWLVVLAAGFVFFTDTHSTFYKWVGGLAHFFANLFCMFYTGLFAAYINAVIFKENIYTGFVFIPLIVFGLGWILGSLVMGLYLTLSMNLFGRHDNETFSALKVQDYKNFLRLHIDEEGTLRIYPVKIERAAQKWRERKEGEGDNAFIIPADGTKPELIEEPIIIKGKK